MVTALHKYKILKLKLNFPQIYYYFPGTDIDIDIDDIVKKLESVKENSAILKLLCGYKHLQKNEQKEAQGNLREGNFTEVWCYNFLSHMTVQYIAVCIGN